MLLTFYKITFLKAFISEFIDYSILTIAFFLIFLITHEFFGKPDEKETELNEDNLMIDNLEKGIN